LTPSTPRRKIRPCKTHRISPAGATNAASGANPLAIGTGSRIASS